MLFSAYQNRGDKDLELRDAFRSTISASRRTEFEELAGTTDLTVKQVDSLRQAVQESIAKRIKPPVLLKTHDARVQHNGSPVVRRELTLGAIYIVRNPLDIVDSLADHMGFSIQKTIDQMNNPAFSIGGLKTSLVTQYLETWSNHAKSWTMQNAFPVHVVRYEDLLDATEFVFRNVLTFLGWPLDLERIEQAIESTKFQNLQDKEAETGFKEKSNKSLSGRFFRKGKAGDWPNILSQQQAEQIIDNHSEMMQRMGYNIPNLDEVYA